MSSMDGSQLAFLTITDGQSTKCAAPPADTRRVVRLRLSASARQCACTIYLVFKEPERPFPLPRDPCFGEPSNLTKALGVCQLLPAFHDVAGRVFQPAGPNNHHSAYSSGGMVEPRRLALADVRRTAPNPPTIRSNSLAVNLLRLRSFSSSSAVKSSIGIAGIAIKHNGSTTSRCARSRSAVPLDVGRVAPDRRCARAPRREPQPWGASPVGPSAPRRTSSGNAAPLHPRAR